jgi:hypothetical protein
VTGASHAVVALAALSLGVHVTVVEPQPVCIRHLYSLLAVNGMNGRADLMYVVQL